LEALKVFDDVMTVQGPSFTGREKSRKNDGPETMTLVRMDIAWLLKTRRLSRPYAQRAAFTRFSMFFARVGVFERMLPQYGK